MLSRIRDHLKGKGVDALVEMIVDLAERDPTLFRELRGGSSVHADDKTLETRLRKAIDSATRTGGNVGYREAEGGRRMWTRCSTAVAELASGGHAGLALKLVGRAIDRIEGAAEEIDDSDGHCSALLDRAAEIHLAATRVVRPNPSGSPVTSSPVRRRVTGRPLLAQRRSTPTCLARKDWPNTAASPTKLGRIPAGAGKALNLTNSSAATTS